eukprot:s6042_g2.t1
MRRRQLGRRICAAGHLSHAIPHQLTSRFVRGMSAQEGLTYVLYSVEWGSEVNDEKHSSNIIFLRRQRAPFACGPGGAFCWLGRSHFNLKWRNPSRSGNLSREDSQRRLEKEMQPG